MKGILFNLAEEVVAEAHGPEVWEQVLDASGLEGAYTSLGNYPDEEFITLAVAAAEIMEAPVNDVVRSIAQGAMPHLVEGYPGFFEGHESARTFVLTLNEIIHPEVRKLYAGADVPEFDFGEGPNGELDVGYRSKRKLCALAEGFIVGAASHYRETATIEQTSCMLDGAESCLLRCSFTKLLETPGG